MLRNVFGSIGKLGKAGNAADTRMQPTKISVAPRKVLNVGGAGKSIPIPPHYDGWIHHILDIDPRGGPDIVADARDLDRQVPGSYDAVYCSHNLEHYFHHDARKVLKGFLHVLNEDGFVEIKVPDILAVMKLVVSENFDLDDSILRGPQGPLQVRDVVWGFGTEIEASGKDFYAHKTGFSPKSLTAFLENAGFAEVFLDGSGPERLEVAAIAFKRAGPNPHKASFGLA